MFINVKLYEELMLNLLHFDILEVKDFDVTLSIDIRTQWPASLSIVKEMKS